MATSQRLATDTTQGFAAISSQVSGRSRGIVEEPPEHHLGVEQQAHQLLNSWATC